MKEYFVKTANANIRYNDFPGNDIPIVFIHGLGCASSFDYPQVAVQEDIKKHRCILVDLLGAGYSDKPEDFDYSVSSHAKYLKEFISDIGLEKFILFGHSLGGAIAISLADLCEDKINNLILTESNLDPSADGSSSKYVSNFTEEEFLNGGFMKLIQNSKKGGNTKWAAALSSCSPKAVYRISKCAANGGEPSWRETLYKLECPKSFIFGVKSLPDRDVEELQKNGINVRFVEDAGHSMAWENPVGLATAIAESIIIT